MGSDEHIFAIGDVHGCRAELERLLEQLPLTPESTILFLGDYVDRGPDAKGVVELIMRLRQERKVVTLMGNHEELLLQFIEQPKSPRAGTFLFNGGGATLASYGTGDGTFRVPDEHLEFFSNLRLFYETDDYFFVHAGVPNKPLESLDYEAFREHMLWMRDPFISTDYMWSKTIVHGHTAVRDVEFRPNRINLDTGCALGNMLTAMELPSRRVFQVQKKRVDPQTHLKGEGRRRAIRFEGAIPVLIERAQQGLELETLDYNEFGILCRDLAEHGLPPMQVGENVSGRIGPDDNTAVDFSGTIVRARREEAIYYAVAIDSYRPRTPV